MLHVVEFQNDGARSYLAAAAYGDVTQDRRIAPDEHVVAYFGIAVAFFLPVEPRVTPEAK
jgi:hypothetical protein